MALTEEEKQKIIEEEELRDQVRNNLEKKKKTYLFDKKDLKIILSIIIFTMIIKNIFL